MVNLPDPDDAPFIEVALAADVPLVTGNERHFPAETQGGCLVLSPAGFVARYCASAATESD
jgi:hypothetical protein